MNTVSTLIGINIVLSALAFAFIFFCLYAILGIEEKINMHIRQNQANQQKLLNRIDEYRVRIDNLESLIEKDQNKEIQENSAVVNEQKTI